MQTAIASAHNPVERALTRAEWQPILFGEPDRGRLAECVASWPCTTLRVRVHRNHAIEPVTAAAEAWAAWNGLAFDWSIGAYDDSLSFGHASAPDIELVWLDLSRLDRADEASLARWLAGRLHALRALGAAPIVVAGWPMAPSLRAALERTLPPATWLADVEATAAKLGERWLDLRAQSISGTRLSNRACLELARELACRWLPAAVLPRPKCIAVDLDGTLYDGVLGEDGVTGITVADAQLDLQQQLARLREEGVLLAVVSRNDRADVDALFAARGDFALRHEDFAAIEATWDDKAQAIARIAERLRIAADAVVCVDDNAGELAAIAAALPVTTVHARAHGEGTAAALRHVAGLFRWQISREDGLRTADLQSAAARDALFDAAASPQTYWRDLRVVLHYDVGSAAIAPRIAELLGKTTQFNLALRRTREAEIVARLRGHPRNVIAIALRDRLADSGIVATLVGDCAAGVLRIDELAVSCRALGRGLEDPMLAKALLLMASGRPVVDVEFAIARGPRNAPAIAWLAGFAPDARDEAVRLVRVPLARFAAISMEAIDVVVAEPAGAAETVA